MRNFSKRIIITGVTGFIGRTMLARLSRSHTVCGVGRQRLAAAPPFYVRAVMEGEDFQRVLTDFHPDVVVHCAGAASVERSIQDPAHDFASGPILLFALYEALRRIKPAPLVVHISSAAVYGAPSRLPVREDDPAVPISPYGRHKLICESIGEEFAGIYGIPGVAMRVFSCYGPGQRKLLLWECCRGIAAGKLKLYGTGQESRDYIHVDDLAEAVDCLIKSDTANAWRVVNVATGESTTVARIVDMLRATMRAEHIVPVYEGRQAPGVPQHWQADVSTLRATGFAPRISLEEGIAEYARWFSYEAKQA
jgi:UDP-glucose 4-epimerase